MVMSNTGKFLNSEAKYSPKYIGDIIFPNDYVRKVVTAYSSGEVTRPLILCGRNGTGKSLLAKLIPQAIEKMDQVVVTMIKAYELNSDHEVDRLLTKNKQFDILFTTNGQRYNYYIIDEMNGLIKGRNAFRVALDKFQGTDLTIITTNEVAKIDKGIRSRCEVLEVPACKPDIFFPHAKKIMAGEGACIDDTALLNALEATYEQTPDNRSYYKLLDRLFREYYLMHLEQESKFYQVPVTLKAMEEMI
jgi:DNA polymerase III delta prime subunit